MSRPQTEAGKAKKSTIEARRTLHRVSVWIDPRASLALMALAKELGVDQNDIMSNALHYRANEWDAKSALEGYLYHRTGRLKDME